MLRRLEHRHLAIHRRNPQTLLETITQEWMTSETAGIIGPRLVRNPNTFT